MESQLYQAHSVDVQQNSITTCHRASMLDWRRRLSCARVSSANLYVMHLLGPFYGAIYSSPLCHALSLSSLSWTSMRRRRATVATPGEWQCKTARSGEWAQHFSNASCFFYLENSQLTTLYSTIRSITEVRVITTVSYQGNAPSMQTHCTDCMYLCYFAALRRNRS